MRKDIEGRGIGSVSIDIPSTRITVGCRYRMTVSYTVGKRGLHAGGVLRFKLPGLYVGYSRPVPVECSRAEVKLEASRVIPVVNGKKGFEFGTEDYLFVTIRNESLVEGDTLSVDYGADITQRYTAAPRCAQAWKVEVAVDLDGCREAPGSGFYLTMNAPVLEFVSDRAFYMELTIPSSTVTGDAFSATVRLRDRYHNLACSYTGMVKLFHGMPGEAPSMTEHRFTPEDRGVHVFEDIVLDRTGINRICAMDEPSSLFARSNPTRTTDEKPWYMVCWGETHCHSCMSDDTSAINDLIPRPAGNYEYARGRSGLDFCMVTDHVEDLGDEEWKETQKAAAEYCEPGRFVTFSAFEATFQPSRKNGDKNVYFMEDNERRISSGATDELYRDLRKRKTRVMVIPHLHVPTNWDLHDPELERVVEVYSHWGCGVSPESTPPFIPGDGIPEKYYVSHALEQGAKIGFIGSADHSLGHPGDDFWWWLSSHNGGLAAVYAPSLTREGIWDALWRRHTYATTRARILLEFEIDGGIMGEEISGPEVGTTGRRLCIGAYGTSEIETVEIIKNNSLFESRLGQGGIDMEFTLTDNNPERQTDYYYVHVVQTDGEQAWSSPIWIDNGDS